MSRAPPTRTARRAEHRRRVELDRRRLGSSAAMLRTPALRRPSTRLRPAITTACRSPERSPSDRARVGGGCTATSTSVAYSGGEATVGKSCRRSVRRRVGIRGPRRRSRLGRRPLTSAGRPRRAARTASHGTSSPWIDAPGGRPCLLESSDRLGPVDAVWRALSTPHRCQDRTALGQQVHGRGRPGRRRIRRPVAVTAYTQPQAADATARRDRAPTSSTGSSRRPRRQISRHRSTSSCHSDRGNDASADRHQNESCDGDALR